MQRRRRCQEQEHVSPAHYVLFCPVLSCPDLSCQREKSQPGGLRRFFLRAWGRWCAGRGTLRCRGAPSLAFGAPTLQMRRSDICRPGGGGGLRATHTQKGRYQGMWTEGAGGWTESFPALLGLLRSLASWEIWKITKIRAREARPEKNGGLAPARPPPLKQFYVPRAVDFAGTSGFLSIYFRPPQKKIALAEHAGKLGISNQSMFTTAAKHWDLSIYFSGQPPPPVNFCCPVHQLHSRVRSARPPAASFYRGLLGAIPRRGGRRLIMTFSSHAPPSVAILPPQMRCRKPKRLKPPARKSQRKRKSKKSSTTNNGEGGQSAERSLAPSPWGTGGCPVSVAGLDCQLDFLVPSLGFAPQAGK
eukprot:gene21068-biopygen10151